MNCKYYLGEQMAKRPCQQDRALNEYAGWGMDVDRELFIH